MIIIGVDTAIRKTGYGILKMESSGSLEILDCGLIRNGPGLKHSECLRRLFRGIRELVETWHPDAASIESAFAGRNIRTAMILSLARGAVIASLADQGIPVYEYSPKTAKRAATGNGEASKEQVASIIAAVGGLSVEQIPDDATDALALAYCHGNFTCRAGQTGMAPDPL